MTTTINQNNNLKYLFAIAGALIEPTQVVRLALAKKECNNGRYVNAIKHLDAIDESNWGGQPILQSTVAALYGVICDLAICNLAAAALDEGILYASKTAPRNCTVEYTGHHGTGGLQSHSIGDEYPYVIYGVGLPDGSKQWAILNGSTGVYYPHRFGAYKQAQEWIKGLQEWVKEASK